MTRLALTALAGLLLLGFSRADAALIAVDDFESYTAGETLEGESGGTGFTSSWNVDAAAAAVTVESGVIPLRGKSMQINKSGTIANLLERAFPELDGTVYVGFLLRTVSFDKDDFLQIYFNDQAGDKFNLSVSGGLRNSGPSGSEENFYFARVDGMDYSDNTDASLTHPNATTRQIVLKFTDTSGSYGGDFDRTDLFVNQLTEGTPNATVSNQDSDTPTLSRIHFRTYSVDTGVRVYLDELRIGTEYVDVVTPEPTAVVGYASLGLMGLVGCARRRRRKR